MVDWSRHKAAVFRPSLGRLKGIESLDPITLDALVGIEEPKRKLIENTEAFLQGREAENVLLWGSRGTGKSSLVKALLNAYAGRGLRVIEFFKEDLRHLPDVLDEIRSEPWRFILFLDDLTFNEGENTYTYLKSAMEGSIEPSPENLLVYATSNRRHLVPEYRSENESTIIREGEIHYSDSVEEKISLADRFGLWLGFYPMNQEQYLEVVEHYFKETGIERELLHREALRFAQERASCSGRTARQFWKAWKGRVLQAG